jgi:pimeloyl-ACP methyl ester carboxylesterase
MGARGRGLRRPRGALKVALDGAAALLIFIVVMFGLMRLLAAIREQQVATPPTTVHYPTIYGSVAAQSAGPASGPPVMIIHGTAAWSGFWKDVTAHLASRGWHVIAVDLPPFGWSQHDTEKRYDRTTQAERLSAVLALAQAKQAVVIGHSFGAGPATEFALRHPEQVRGLVLVDAALGELDPKGEGQAVRLFGFRPVSEAATSATITNPYAIEGLLSSMLARKDVAKRWVPVLREPMRRQGTTAAYAEWLPSLLTRDDGSLSRKSANLAAMRMPVALIWGGADTVTPLAQGKRLAALTRARSLIVLPGVGHIPHIEDPEHFQTALDSALGSVSNAQR